MKLYVTNDKDEVLLPGDDEGLEITGARYNESLSVREFVIRICRRMGIEIKNFRLWGLLTFHYASRSNPTLMYYYTAEYKSGLLILPEGCEVIKWVLKEKTEELVPIEEMNQVISKINQCDYLFGGCFKIWKDETTQKRKSKIIEPFCRLN